MRKFIALVLAFMFIFTLGFNALALEDAPPIKNFEIPRAPAGFEIGDLDLAKWNGALVIDWDQSNTWVPTGMDGGGAVSMADFLGAKFCFLWAPEGIYFYADIKSKFAVPISAPAIDEAHNRGNGIQFFPAAEATNDMPGWTFSPYTTPDGKADVWRHWPDEDNDSAAKIFVEIGSNGNDYIMEGLMPASSFAIANYPVTIAEGVKFGMNNVILQAPEDGVHTGFGDSAWFDVDGYNIYTLSGNVAPGAPEPEPEPEIIIEEEAPAAAPAPVAEAAPAPQTSDAFIIMLMLAIFAAALIIKNSKRIYR